MTSFMLVLLLVSSSGQHVQMSLQGFDELHSCQDIKTWYESHDYIRTNDRQVYHIEAMECVRSVAI